MWNLISIIFADEINRGSMNDNSLGYLNFYASSIVRADDDSRLNALQHGILFIENEV